MNKKILILLVLSIALSISAGKMVSKMSLFPADLQNGRFAVNRGAVAAMLLKTSGDGRAMAKQQAVLIVELPEDTRLLAAAGEHPQCPDPFKITTEKFQKDGKKFVRYRITPAKNYLKRFIRPELTWACGITLYLQSGAKNSAFAVPLYWSVAGKKLHGAEFTLAVTSGLPKGAPLKKFRIGCSYLPAGTQNLPEMLDSQLGYWRSLAERPMVFANVSFAGYPEYNRRKMNELCDMVLYGSCKNDETPRFNSKAGKKYGFTHAAATRPGVRLLEGVSVRSGGICPQYLLEDPDKVFWDGYFAESIGELKASAPKAVRFMLNFEPRVDNGTCEVCRRAFADFAGLKQIPDKNQLKTPVLIRHWSRFKQRQRNEIIKKMSQTIRRWHPEIKFGICTIGMLPNNAHLNGWCGVDLAAAGKSLDFITSMLYSPGLNFYESLELNRKNMKSTQLPIIDPAEQAERWFKRYTPANVRQCIFSAAALEAEGLIFYPQGYYDAAMLSVISDSCRVLAEVEESYFGTDCTGLLRADVLNGCEIELEDGSGNSKKIRMPDFSSQVKIKRHSGKAGEIITIFNFSSNSPIYLLLALPDYRGQAETAADLISGCTYTEISPRNGFIVKVAPSAVAVLKLGALTGKNVSAAAMRREKSEYVAAEQKLNAIYRSEFQGKSGVFWKILNKQPVLCLKTSKDIEAAISPENGAAIVAWRSGIRKDPGSLIMAELIPSESSSERNYQPVSTEFIADGSVCALLRRTFGGDAEAGGDGNKLEGLAVNKKVVLTPSGMLETTFVLTNSSKKTLDFDFRIKNIPFVYNPKIKAAPHFTKNIDNASQSMKIIGEYGGYGCEIQTSGAVDVLWWNNGEIYTCEPIFKGIRLAPGESRTFVQTARRFGR